MLELVLSAVLFAHASHDMGAQGDEGKEEGPSREQVEATLEALDEAFDHGEPEERARALRRASEVVHPDVVAAVTRGLKDAERLVRAAALEALRWMPHPDALEALHKTYKRDKTLRKDPELSGTLLKAIGQHGSASSIAVLTDNPFATPHRDAIRARILGLGNIRHERSIEALLDLLEKAGGRDGRNPYMDDFRLSLIVLSGTDRGKAPEQWRRWWSDNKKDFEVAAELPPIPEELYKRWVYYWGLEPDWDRRTRREDRGDDPERDARRGG